MVLQCPACHLAYEVSGPRAFRCKCGALVHDGPPVASPVTIAAPPPARAIASPASPPVVPPIVNPVNTISNVRVRRPKAASYWSHPGALLLPAVAALILIVGGALAALSDYPIIYFGVTLLVLFFAITGCLVAAFLLNYRWVTPKPQAKMLALCNVGIFVLAGVLVRGGIDLDKADANSGNKDKRLASSTVATRETAKAATGLKDAWQVTADPPPVVLATGDYPLTTQISWYSTPPADLPPLGQYDMPVSAVVSSGAQRYFAICTADTPPQLQVWDLQSGAMTWSRPAPGRKTFVFDVSRDGQHLLLGQDPQAYPFVAEIVSAGDTKKVLRIPPVEDDNHSAMHRWLGRYRFLSDNEVFYFRSYRAADPSGADAYRPRILYHVLDLTTSRIRMQEVEGDWFGLPVVSPGGKWIATTFSKQLAIYDFASGARGAYFAFKSDFPSQMAFSPDGTELAYRYGPHSGAGCGLRIIDLATGNELAHFRYTAAGHDVFSEAGGDDPRFLYYSRDGSRLIYNGLTFIDRQTGERLAGRTQEAPIYLTWARAVLDKQHVLALDRDKRSFQAIMIEGL